MAFSVEDGSGLSGANSYCTVAEADSYFKDRATTSLAKQWLAATTQEKQSALVVASDYIEVRFSKLLPGHKVNNTQGLVFPRIGTNGFDSSIPYLLKRAVCEYGVRALSAPLAPDVQTPGISTFVKKKKLGPLETDYGVVSQGIGSTITKFILYPVPDSLMFNLLGAGSGTYR